MKEKKLQKKTIINWIEIFIILFLAWIIMSGIFELKFMLYAVLACAAISTLCLRLLNIQAMKSKKIYFMLEMNWFRFIAYFGWLLVQILKSAWYVSKVTLIKRDEISPSVVWFSVDYDNPVAAALLANSITLTPGTITIDIKKGVYSVHALTDETAEGVLDGSMQKKVAWVFGEDIKYRTLLKGKELNKLKKSSTKSKGGKKND